MTNPEEQSEIARTVEAYAELRLQQLEAELDDLQGYIDQHESLIANGPDTILKLQRQCDMWRNNVADLIRIADPTVNQLFEAGFEVTVDIDGE